MSDCKPAIEIFRARTMDSDCAIFDNELGIMIDLDNVSYIDYKRMNTGDIVVYVGSFSVALHGPDCQSFLDKYTQYKANKGFYPYQMNEHLHNIHERLRDWR